MRGGDKVLESLCEMFPGADVYTHVYCPERMSDTVRSQTIKTTFINKLPYASKLYQKYLPLMPIALEQLDMRPYDLVISSESGPAKGVITRPDTLHVCYCHTPMRYLWNMYHDYFNSSGSLIKAAMPLIFHQLRQWDFASAARVDHFVANSNNVARRINKYYRRAAEVVYPPVDVEDFQVRDRPEPFYLMVGEMVGYKRTDLAVEAFNVSGKPLVIIGEGEQFDYCKKIAKPNIQFLGRRPFSDLKDHYSRCRALIFPGEEDFGIVPVEAMASGRPVIAFGRGGAEETVIPGQTGVFFHEQTVHAINQAIDAFEAMDGSFEPTRIANHARNFARSAFKSRMSALIERWMDGGAARTTLATAAGHGSPGHSTTGLVRSAHS